jgi:class 3 adenylate cyclase
VASGLAIAGSALSAANGRPPQVFLPLGVSGVVYATAGAFIYARQPRNRIGPALLIAGAVPAALVVAYYLAPVTLPFNIAFATAAITLPIAYIALSFPVGRLTGTIERRAFAATLAFALGASIVELVTVEPPLLFPGCSPCTSNPLRIFDPSLYPLVTNADSAAFVFVVIALTVILLRRWRRTGGLTRQALTPIVFGAIFFGLTNAVFLILEHVFDVNVALSGQILLLLRLLIPVGLVAVLLRFYEARGAVMRTLVQLGPGTNVPALEAALQRSLADPDLAVLRWSPAAGDYIDANDQVVALGDVRGHRDVLAIERDGDQIAAVLHDPVLGSDRELMTVIAETVRYTAEVADLRQELVARGGDVERLPQGDVAFLFGDVERSTELLQRLGDAYAGTIARLREIVRREAERNSGYVVDMRADECFLAFASAADAVAAAEGIQRKIEHERWPADTLVRLRIGLHAGRPELTASGYVGLDVHHAARVMASALGGQIIASQALVQALGGSHGPGVTVSPLGTFALRGIPGEETLFEVRAT